MSVFGRAPESGYVEPAGAARAVAFAVGLVAAAVFVASVLVAWARARAAREPVRLPRDPAAGDAFFRLREVALASCAALAVILLRDVHAWTADRGAYGLVASDESSFAVVSVEMAILGVAAAVFAASSCALALAARRAARLPSGLLEDAREGPRVRVGETTYLLTAVPEGLADGDPVLFLATATDDAGGTGPYRTGLPTTLAPKIWRGQSALLARHLFRRARRHAAWAALAAVTLAFLVL